MKKISVRLLAVCLVVMLLGTMLASCGNKLSGTYENNTFNLITTYTFSGDEFTRTMSGLDADDEGLTVSGTYRIEKDMIYLTTSYGTVEELTFSKSGNTICIAEMEFVKK